jgi:hypothetical protein
LDEIDKVNIALHNYDVKLDYYVLVRKMKLFLTPKTHTDTHGAPVLVDDVVGRCELLQLGLQPHEKVVSKIPTPSSLILSPTLILCQEKQVGRESH